MQGIDRKLLGLAVGLGGLAGARCSLPGAVVAAREARREDDVLYLRRRSDLRRKLASVGVRRILAILSAGELAFDKAPWTPARIAPAGLLARVVAGAGAAASLGGEPGRKAVRMTAAVAAAVGASFGLYHLRAWATRRGMSRWVAALVEDGLALSGAAALTRA